jgi:hypothetical protein
MSSSPRSPNDNAVEITRMVCVTLIVLAILSSFTYGISR